MNLDLTDPYSSLFDGLEVVVDEKGNIYEIPSTGNTPLVTINDNHYIKYRYNWANKEIEIFVLNEETNKFNYLDSISLNPYDYIDNPEYWYQMAYEEFKDYSEVEDILVEEAVKAINASITDDEYEYEYFLTSYVNILTDSDNWSDIIEDIEDNLSEYFDDVVIDYQNDSKIRINITLDTMAGDVYLNIKIESAIPLDKSDFDSIFDDLKFDIENFDSDKLDYSIKLLSGYRM